MENLDAGSLFRRGRAYLDRLFRTPSAAESYQRGREAEEHFWNSGDESSRRNAIAWYRRAAEQNHAPGQRALGWMYQCEDHDVDPREEEPTDDRAWGFGTRRAEAWYRRAAEQGNPLAQVQVGLWHHDDERSTWFRRAAEQGFALGQLRRVRLFFVGGRISLCGSEAGGNWIRHGVVREQRRGPVADGTCAVSDGWGCSAGTRALGGGSQYASMRRRPVAA